MVGEREERGEGVLIIKANAPESIIVGIKSWRLVPNPQTHRTLEIITPSDSYLCSLGGKLFNRCLSERCSSASQNMAYNSVLS